jgi:hypothetical protein
MKYLYHILIFICIIGCDQKTSKNKTKESGAQRVENCLLKEYDQAYSNKIHVNSVYYECESDWKFRLKIKRNEDLIFEADTLHKYKFKNHTFPTYIETDSLEYVLIERSDRSLFNKTDVFRISKGKVDSIFSIPHFELKGMDIDKDGINEYWATLNFVESNGRGTIGYNPILVYEIESDRINFDSTTTVDLNKKVYGQFLGLSIIDTLYFNGNQIEEKWPYPTE